jgi:hypothetical protein
MRRGNDPLIHEYLLRSLFSVRCLAWPQLLTPLARGPYEGLGWVTPGQSGGVGAAHRPLYICSGVVQVTPGKIIRAAGAETPGGRKSWPS